MLIMLIYHLIVVQVQVHIPVSITECYTSSSYFDTFTLETNAIISLWGLNSKQYVMLYRGIDLFLFNPISMPQNET